MRRTECTCGSGLYPRRMHDGYNIFLCYACDKCEKEKMSKFRPDIHSRYECDEAIEED